MKISIKLFLLIFTVAISSCKKEEKVEWAPKTKFDSPFPKRNRNLTNILGDHLVIKRGEDTLAFTISAFKQYNLITNDKTGDTLFKGTVSKFRGLYYFSEQLNDTSFYIYAVKLSDNLIYGLSAAWRQLFIVDAKIEKGEHEKLVKYIRENEYRLRTNKKELKRLFSSIIDSITPDTILQLQEYGLALKDTSKVIAPIDPDDFEFISKVYPNPVTDFVTVELQQKQKVTYQLTDINGKTTLQGQFDDTKNKIDLSGQTAGLFYLTLINQANNQKETTKIVKIQ